MKTSPFKRAAVLAITLAILVSSLSAFTFASTGYKDVPDGKWFSEAIAYVSDKGYFSGTGDGVFSPNSNMTRAMFVQTLAAASGDDLSEYNTDSYTDVPAGKWFSHAVAWAEKTGVASGVGAGIFSPNSNITRESVCLMLVKFLDYKTLIPRVTSDTTVPFADDSSISGWAKSAVDKVRSWSMIGGKPGNLFDPKGNATRAELAVIIMKLDKAMKDAYKIKVKNIEVEIPGLTKEYTFMHISDSHLTLTDENDSIAAKSNQDARGAAFLNEIEGGVKQEERFDDHMAYAKEKNVDFVAMTGDIIDAPSSGNINHLANAVKDFGGETLFLLGNHDWTGDWIGSYQSDAQRNNSIPKFTEAGIMVPDEDSVFVREYDEFVIIGIDDSNDQVTIGQYSTLQKYINKRKPIILMLHVPLDVETLQADATAKWGRPILLGNPVLSPNNYTKMFVNMIKAPNSTVVAVFTGHVHFDHEDVINEYTGAKQYTLGASLNGDCAIVKIHG